MARLTSLMPASSQSGLQRFPNDVFLTITYSSFLMEVQSNYSTGHTQLQAAKKLQPGMSDQFAIFVREQEHKQKAQSQSTGEGTVDLVSYVEFQRNYGLLLKAHKRSLSATKSFWKVGMAGLLELHPQAGCSITDHAIPAFKGTTSCVTMQCCCCRRCYTTMSASPASPRPSATLSSLLPRPTAPTRWSWTGTLYHEYMTPPCLSMNCRAAMNGYMACCCR